MTSHSTIVSTPARSETGSNRCLPWRTEFLLWDSGPGAPAENMAWDEALLVHAPSLPGPLLRFYAWRQPAATFGYFQRHAVVQTLTALRPLLRRPTAGGVVPHDADWTYSLIIPPDHPWHRLRAVQSYQRLHRWLQAALARIGATTELARASSKSVAGACFAGPDAWDVVSDGRKIAGAAQRRTRHGLLIQGSVQPAKGWPYDAWRAAVLDTAREAWGIAFHPFWIPADVRATMQALLESKHQCAAYQERV